jgi:hypothetical protein
VMPPIGQSTSVIGTGTIGTPTTVGSAVGSLGQTSIGVPTVQSTFGSMRNTPVVSPTGSGGGAAQSTIGSGAGSGVGASLECLPQDFICGGVVVRP